MSKLQEFLKDYDNASTRSGYQSALYAFIKYVYTIKPPVGRKNVRHTTPEDKVKYEALIDKYLKEKRNHKDDVMGFRTSMKDRPPLSQRQTINLVREFLACNGAVIEYADMKRIRRKIKGGTVTSENDFDVETIRKILMFMDAKGKALLLTLLASGMRIGETLCLRDSDVDLDAVPAKITIPAECTKTKQLRYTFLTPQAVDALRVWLEGREKYLESSNGKNRGLVKKNKSKVREDSGDKLFPFAISTANQLFENAVINAGLMSKDKRTNRSQIHIHQTRKFFISQMAMVTSSKEIPETLAGHGGSMTEAYRRHPVKQLQDEYLKSQHVLTISEEQELKAVEAGFKKQLQEHSGVIADTQIELKNLREVVQEQQSQIAKLMQILEMHEIPDKVTMTGVKRLGNG